LLRRLLWLLWLLWRARTEKRIAPAGRLLGLPSSALSTATLWSSTTLWSTSGTRLRSPLSATTLRSGTLRSTARPAAGACLRRLLHGDELPLVVMSLAVQDAN
jgi:hypothetical protein